MGTDARCCLATCLAMLSLCILMSACTVGPNYAKPAVDVPASWELSEQEAKAFIDPRWWEGFGDPELNRLVLAALNENRDLKVAVAAVEEFRALLGVAQSDYYPQLNASASASRSKAAQSGNPPYPPNPYSTQYLASLNLSYELDLWGRIRRAEEAARADLLSREEAKRGVMLSVVSQVATAYLQLLDLDKRLDIARSTLISREEAYKLAKIRFKGGLTSELDVYQSAVELASAQTLIPQLEQQIQQTEHLISVLIGHNPARIKRGKGFDDLAAPTLPSLLPSELLKRRPDILQAEQALIAANARIGQAIAGYYPQISLTAMLGESSGELVFNWPTTLINAGVSATAPLFTGWRTQRQVEATEAREQQARFQYEQTVMTAFREVYDALVAQRMIAEQVAIQTRQIAALQDTLRIARLRYLNGYTSYIDVLDAQRNLLNAELSIVQTRSGGYQTIVELYRALGGGWGVGNSGGTEK
ncbi:MAG TPA: efflux transporter outer membrane subunit [Desulfuromonadaceae bacterium]